MAKIFTDNCHLYPPPPPHPNPHPCPLNYRASYNLKLYSFIIIQPDVKSPCDRVECGECGLFFCCLLFLPPFGSIVLST